MQIKVVNHQKKELCYLPAESGVPRQGDYLHVSHIPKRYRIGEHTLDGFGSFVKHVSWHYDEEQLKEIVVEIE